MALAKDIEKDLLSHANKKKIPVHQRFFKTGKGEYGENDIFIGVNLPSQRIVARKYYDKLNLNKLRKLLTSPVHEHRLTSLIILNIKYKKCDDAGKKKIFDFYLKYRKHINNWDLVDSSAPYILGKYLMDKPRGILTRLARSKSLWDKRIAIVTTWAFIRENQYDDTLRLAKMLLSDKHDLIHKASGWMLKEISKRDVKPVEDFLNKHASVMPRRMLRYTVEKLPVKKRIYYMKKKIK
jgi:3-methyladenine DNA glycosylase AlkD